ncbi:MAG: putative toxin-antitoxin system toxin component, PIN family [Candidatus Eremiobacteraeota bacterium]|nr:putative toxin-antitoxin system toxin component, PIN family [Candidatus Eremiobacteraeota bacterium]
MGKRIVIDTNVLISALGWSGAERALLMQCRKGVFQLVISLPLLKELERVLHYKKLKFQKEEQREFLSLVLELSVIVEPKESFDAISAHPPDNRILECACEGQTEYIISGDEHLLHLSEFHGIKIMRAPDFLKAFQKRF